MRRFWTIATTMAFVLLAMLVCVACMFDAAANEPATVPVVKTYVGTPFVPQKVSEEEKRQARLAEEAYKEIPQEQESRAEEPVLMADGSFTDAKVSFYCTERYAHICGAGTGLTASGREVMPWKSVAVDPEIIPLGSTVYVNLNGEILELRADDTGSAVKGAHIDIAVGFHDEALELGLQTANVWWCEP